MSWKAGRRSEFQAPLSNMADDFSDLRQEYRHVALLEQDADRDPIAQFRDWFRQAVAYGVPLPNAMALATVARDGKPSVRFVLLKDLSDAGFSFYTHSTSAKGRQMAENPEVALVFYWTQMHRQVRVEGRGAAAFGRGSRRLFQYPAP